LVIAFAITALVWADLIEESWTIYSNTNNNGVLATAHNTFRYTWSVGYHTGTWDLYIRANPSGPYLVNLSGQTGDQHGTVVLQEGVTYQFLTNGGSASQPGNATIVLGTAYWNPDGPEP
jgi:hypothetical protein